MLPVPLCFCHCRLIQSLDLSTWYFKMSCVSRMDHKKHTSGLMSQAACWPLPKGLVKHLLQYWFIITPDSWSLPTSLPQGSQQCREPLWCSPQPDSVVIETAFSNLSHHGYICWDVTGLQTSRVLVFVSVKAHRISYGRLPFCLSYPHFQHLLFLNKLESF